VTPTSTPTTTPTDTPTQTPTATPTDTATSTPSPSATPADCTFGAGFWKTNPDAWPVSSITVGFVTYTREEAIEIMEMPALGDATIILFGHLVPAKLSILSGADGSSINETISAADDWLFANGGVGSDPQGEAREEGIMLAAELEAFNNGTTGPTTCTAQSGATVTAPGIAGEQLPLDTEALSMHRKRMRLFRARRPQSVTGK
jgi:hypothetical protein